jgi:hypothetical protein
MIEQIPVYYLRHTFEGRDDLVRELYQRHLGAVDYEGGKSLSTSPEDYHNPTAKRVIKQLGDIAKRNLRCLFACDYRVASSKELVVGLFDCSYGFRGVTLCGVDVKTVQLSSPKILHYRDWPLFAACHPQRGTFCEWQSMGKSLLHWYFEGRIPREVGSLTPGQLELLCYEWLCKKGEIQHLLAPIGRSLKDVDIAAATNSGKRLFAQVTFDRSIDVIKDKAKRLSDFCNPKDTAILFCDSPSKKIDGVEIISIHEVFEQSRTELLDDILGIKS